MILDASRRDIRRGNRDGKDRERERERKKARERLWIQPRDPRTRRNVCTRAPEHPLSTHSARRTRISPSIRTISSSGYTRTAAISERVLRVFLTSGSAFASRSRSFNRTGSARTPFSTERRERERNSRFGRNTRGRRRREKLPYLFAFPFLPFFLFITPKVVIFIVGFSSFANQVAAESIDFLLCCLRWVSRFHFLSTSNERKKKNNGVIVTV